MNVRARALVALVAAVVAALALPAVRSGATMNSRTANPGTTVVADTPVNYVRLWSQPTDPTGLTGYELRRNSAPAVPAASGADAGLTVHLGGNKNANDLAHTRVLVIEALDPLPAGASPVTVSVSLAPDPTSGLQPLSGFTLSNLNGTGAAATATMTAGVRKELNLTVTTQGFPASALYVPTVTLTVTFPGYAGGFLSTVVPVRVWDGNGAGP